MRRLAMLLIILVLASTAWAQAPATMPVQMNLTDSQGAAVTGTVTVTFSIYDSEGVGTGMELWGPEDHTVTTTDGVISVLLGNGDTPVPIDTGIFNGQLLFLSVRVNGGSEMDPRLPIGSSAYAFSADRTRSLITRILYAGSTVSAPMGNFELMRSLGTFTKRRSDTALRVTWLAHVQTASAGGFCQYQLRIDGIKDDGTSNVTATFGNTGEAVSYALDQAVNVMTIFDGISAGAHDVEIWLRGGSTTSCQINKGNFQNQVIVEEFLPDNLVVSKTQVSAQDSNGLRLQMGVENGRF